MSSGCGTTDIIALALLAALVAGCARGEQRASARGESASAAISVSVASSEQSRAAQSAATPAPESSAAIPVPPPAHDSGWSKSEVVERLTEAGFVVTDSGQSANHEKLRVTGSLLHLGRGELQIYLYPDVAARKRDAAGLDTALRGFPRLDRPRYIESGNLIAILKTPSDRTAERVENVLTSRHAGG